MKNKIGIIVSREYYQRVRKKSFIITTLVMPLLILGLMCLPALLANVNMSGPKEVGVIDPTGLIADKLPDNGLARFTRLDVSPDSLNGQTGYDAFLILPANVIERPAGINFLSRDAGTMNLEMYITESLDEIIEQERLERLNMGDLKTILKDVEVHSTLATSRLNDSGEIENSSSIVSFAIGMIMSVLLYFFLLMYGQMVMTSIVEEKSNRVLELVVTSVKPLQIMMGKIIGVGLVAVTQLGIWAVIIIGASTTLLPMLMSPELSAEVAAAGSGSLDMAQASIAPEGLQALAIAGNVGYLISIFGWLLLFLVGGFLLYAAIYAAIGSAVDNVQDGAQLQSFVLMPLIIGFVFSTSIASDPNSTVAFWLSVVPFTSPMVMMTRIPFGIPVGQILLSLAVLYASFVAMVWFAGKVYRVGIFMHGKKPSIKEIVRWTRYK